MKCMRRLGAAAVIAALMATGTIATAPLEAAKKGGGDGQAATCEYLLNIITYPYVSPYIQVWAISLYNSYGCPAVP